MNYFRFIDLTRFINIKETRPNFCIPTTAELILKYYGENKWTRDKIYNTLTKSQIDLSFQGFKQNFEPLLTNFEIEIQSHNSNILQLIQFVKKNINEENPFFSAVKSDYAKSSLESGNYSKLTILIREKPIELILFTNNNAQSKATHIIPIIGYSDKFIFMYEFNERVIFGVDYLNNDFNQIIQEGSFNTMTIRLKKV